MDEEQILARLADLERKIDWLYRNAGYPQQFASSADPVAPDALVGTASAAVLDLVRRGNKIGAIKQYCEETGVGLKEAKTFVESLEG
jgi:ribosomal protein L7/L12